MAIKHAKQSTQGDGPDPTDVQPSDWNTDHVVEGFLGLFLSISGAPNTFPYIKADGTAGLWSISSDARAALAAANNAAILVSLGAAGLASPALTGAPTSTTPPAADNSFRIATTQYVRGELASLVAAAPTTLDTLNEIATALGNDANFSATITTALGFRLRFDAAQTLTSPQKAQAVANLGLATVAVSGSYTDLTGLPTLGTAAALNFGTGPNQLVRLDGSSKLPALDGSQLTNVTAAGRPVINIVGRAGSFDVWQRGAGGSASIAVAASTTAYTADGWYIATGASQAFTVSEQAGIAVGSLKAAKVQRNSGQTGTGTVRFAMPLDESEVALIAGNFVALSFTIKEGANQSFAHSVTATLFVGTGAVAKRNGSAYTGETSAIALGVTTTTTAARVAVTSAAIIPAATKQAEIQFSWTPSGTAGADDSFTVDDLQIEIVPASSAVASPYAGLTFSEQLRRCLHHYEKSYNYGTAPGTAVGAGSNGIINTAGASTASILNHPLQSPKRKALVAHTTLLFYDGVGTVAKGSYFNGTAWSDGVPIGNANPSGTEKFVNAFFSGMVSAVYVGFDYAADASI